MTKEEAIKLAKKNYWFLEKNPQWNNDENVVSIVVDKFGWALCFVSNELRDNEKIVLMAIKNFGLAIQYASERLQKNRKFIAKAIKKNALVYMHIQEEFKTDRELFLEAVRDNSQVCQFTTVSKYKNFKTLVKEEGEVFLFSCFKNKDFTTRILVANHPNFIPTLEQMEIGLQDKSDKVRDIYKLRQNEWNSKRENNYDSSANN